MNRLGFKQQKGLSLIEFMVAGLIGLILTAGLVQIFASNSQAFNTTTASANVQETARISSEILGKAVRNADFWGCAAQGDVFNNLDVAAGTAFSLGFGSGLEGEDNNSDSSDDIVDGTDSFTVRGTRGSSSVQITSPMPASSANLNVNDHGSFEVGEVVLISDCKGGDVFQITKLPPGGPKINHHTGNTVTPGNSKDPASTSCSSPNCLSQSYVEGASIMQPYSETYYIGTGAGGGPALFMRRSLLSGSSVGNVESVELVDGVQDMQILYGEDTNSDGNADQYRAASAVNDMEDVKSLRISLLLQSSRDRALSKAQSLTYNGNNIDGSDLRLRRVYTLTSTLRNRM